MEKEEIIEEIKKEKEYKKLVKDISKDIEKFEELIEYAQDDCDEEFFTADLKKCKKELKAVNDKLASIQEYKKEYNV
jgi:flagellar biosynthesis chaperone FliJ